jgi:hypothetical protein
MSLRPPTQNGNQGLMFDSFASEEAQESDLRQAPSNRDGTRARTWNRNLDESTPTIRCKDRQNKSLLSTMFVVTLIRKCAIAAFLPNHTAKVTSNPTIRSGYSLRLKSGSGICSQNRLDASQSIAFHNVPRVPERPSTLNTTVLQQLVENKEEHKD